MPMRRQPAQSLFSQPPLPIKKPRRQRCASHDRQWTVLPSGASGDRIGPRPLLQCPRWRSRSATAAGRIFCKPTGRRKHERYRRSSQFGCTNGASFMTWPLRRAGYVTFNATAIAGESVVPDRATGMDMAQLQRKRRGAPLPRLRFRGMPYPWPPAFFGPAWEACPPLRPASDASTRLREKLRLAGVDTLSALSPGFSRQPAISRETALFVRYAFAAFSRDHPLFFSIH